MEPQGLSPPSLRNNFFLFKMADNAVCSEVSSHIISKSKGNISEYDCKKCSEYETQLKEVLDELDQPERSSKSYKRNYSHLHQQRTHMTMTWEELQQTLMTTIWMPIL
jgi:hypothetical protein